MALVWFVVALVLGVTSFIFFRKWQSELQRAKNFDAENQALRSKYANIITVDEEVERRRKDLFTLDQSIQTLRQSYQEKKVIYDRLDAELRIYQDELEMVDLGFYDPHFDFDTSERYRQEIESVRSQQKQLIKDKRAILCETEWTVDGSKAEGRKMSDRAIKITARAFNNECEACVSNVRWNNVERMEERIRKSFDAINKLNASNRVMISESYLRLKLKELRLVYEHQQKLQDEKEEQAEMRRRLKEEERFEQEAQNAQKEELKYAKLLEKARAESQKAMGADLIKLNSEIARLTADLAQAQAKSQRALSMAQQTKVGHVYIISNIGSFGENVYKIGMTRRLEPMERVKELGDASVPFLFDVHAMIYCEDAPKLEKALHKAFEPKRLNMTNNRREFFHVTLDEIKIEVAKLYPNIDFVEVPEAMEFRQSLAIRHEKLVSQDAKSQIPSAI